jgi:hypothetical protein
MIHRHLRIMPTQFEVGPKRPSDKSDASDFQGVIFQEVDAQMPRPRPPEPPRC